LKSRASSFFAGIWSGHRKQAATVVALVAVLAVGGGAVFVLAAPASAPATASMVATASATAEATPTPIASPTPTVEVTASAEVSLGPSAIPAGWAYADLDGVAAPADQAHRLPLAIMIDDYKKARPQSGLSSASIVYQAMIDDSSDRYMMVFQEGTATDIGPVRSSRPYFVYWAAEYKALYGHFGGDAQALQKVIPAMAGNIYNMDDLNGGSCPYHRIATRVSPYNAYTNTSELIRCLPKRKYPATYQNLPTRAFVGDSPASDLPASQTISIPYLAETIGYQFDPSTDAYLRLIDGKLQTDPANNQQVVARNVVVMFQSYSVVPSLDKMRPSVANVGSGKAIVFKEGKAIAGTWKKPANAALTQLYDQSGKVIPLVRGEIFMQSVPIGTAVTYK
jgi:hypothetical protein